MIYIYAWDMHNKNHIHWIFQDDDIGTTPYSRARSNTSTDNISATELNTMSYSHILFKSTPEGEFKKWITWKNIKLNRHGKLLTNEKERKCF